MMFHLQSAEDLERALSSSEDKPVFIFKHSTTCPISASAHGRVISYLDEEGRDAPPFFLVKVIESRPVSNEIASRSGVVHQSPQLILIDSGKAVWDASHGAIQADAIRQAWESSASADPPS